jgi:hypothetical protein
MTPDPVTAVLDQLAAHHEQISDLDAREADHFASVSGRLTELTDTVTAVGRTLAGDTPALSLLEALQQQVSQLSAELAGPDTDPTDTYQPGPPPAWWKLSSTERQEPAARLRAWVDQVYLPGYGHVAATLGRCWGAHDLCLYGLDILSQLWSVLYLQPRRSAALLSAQAEYQARILPAIASQLMTETTGCGHDLARTPAASYPRSTP